MKKDPFFEYFIKNRTSLSQKMFKESNVQKNKEYLRFSKVILPKAKNARTSFSDMVSDRCSVREYADAPISLQQISDLLYWSFGFSGKVDNNGFKKRAQPSGGNKYPLELYIYNIKGGEIDKGLYHYNVEKHLLEDVTVLVSCKDLETDLFNNQDEFIKKSGMIIFFAFSKGRSFEKYGSLAYKLALLEAGHVSQNIYLLASSLRLGVCGLGSFGYFEEMLAIENEDEFFFYGISIGALL